MQKIQIIILRTESTRSTKTGAGNITKLQFSELTLLAAIWGGSFLFLRIASPEFGPIALIFVRVSVAALVLMPLIWHRSEFHILLKHWRKFLWAGACTTALPFTLLSYVSLSMTVGNTTLLNATVPMFSAIIAWFWLKERLTWIGIAGMLLGFIGVFVLATPEGGDYSSILLPILAAIAATNLYAYGSCFTSLYMRDFPSITVTAGSQLYSALFMLPFGLWFWPEQNPSLGIWLCVLTLGVLCTAIALIMFYHLLRRIGVAKTVSVTYLMPVFGILWGWIFLNESATPNMLVGGMLILAGVGLTTSSSAKQAVTLS